MKYHFRGHNHCCFIPIILKLFQQVSYYSGIILIKSVAYYSQNYSGIIGSSLIRELHVHENWDFVVPVNIFTPFVCAPFSWAVRHTTVCLDNNIQLAIRL